MGTEIERKFLVTTFEPTADGASVEQGYIALDGDVEVRVRRKGGTCTLTLKQGGGLQRVEVEQTIDDDTFEALWPSSAGRRVTKVRHAVPADDLTIEVDVFTGDLAGLVVAEVEFDDTARAGAWTPPDWFGRELTGETGWSNAALARAGRPD